MAIVAKGSKGRIYLPPDDQSESIAQSAEDYPIVADARITFLSGATPTRAMIAGGVCSAYGLSTWGTLFTSRQLVALMTISGLVRELREQSLNDGKAGGLPDDSISLSAGGRGAIAYSEAVATYLSMCVSRQANRTSSLSFWDNGAENIQQVFGRQALAMTWDFAESNPFSDSSGGLSGQFNYLCKVISASPQRPSVP